MSTSARRRLMRDFKVRLIQVAAAGFSCLCPMQRVTFTSFWVSQHISLLPA